MHQKIRLDYAFFIFAFLICSFGITAVYSSSALKAISYYGNSYIFLKKQFASLALGGFGCLLIWLLPSTIFKRVPLAFGLFSLILLVYVLFDGITVKGATRWMTLFGVRFQPSEIAKIAFVFLIAKNLTRNPGARSFSKKFGTSACSSIVLYLAFFIPLILEPDFGNSFLLLVCLVTMLAITGLRFKYLVVATLFAIFSGAIAIAIAPYRMKRILSFLDPWSEQNSGGFQIIQSFVAFYNGAFFGAGAGESKQKLFFLPEAHSDFILSVIAEELGFVGVSFLVLLYCFFAHLSYQLVINLRDKYYQVLAAGISSLILVQSALNMGVVTGMLPTKGITLPFISAGASSLLVFLLCVGILGNLAKNSLDLAD